MHFVGIYLLLPEYNEHFRYKLDFLANQMHYCHNREISQKSKEEAQMP